MSDSLVVSKVGAPLLKFFSLEGVNGYKTISARFERNVKIISAENGSGKTTLLNALYALLAGKGQKLLAIHFSRFTLKFTNGTEISMDKSELFPPNGLGARKRKGGENSFLREFLNPVDFDEMLFLFSSGQDSEFRNCSGYRQLEANSPFDSSEIVNFCKRELQIMPIGTKFSEVYTKIKAAMNGVAVLYLPTFRRIEAELPEYQRVNTESRHRIKGGDWDEDRLIFFGLQDVTRRLEAIVADIRKGTFEAYSRISGRTLDQLLSAGPAKTEMNLDDVEVDMLKMVFARLGRSDSPEEQRVMELISSGQINNVEHQSLRSFLGQLLEVYQEKRDLELAVESFVNVVDAYWNHPASEKRFQFNKKTVEAHAIDTHTNKQLPLGTLSSGEKQIVSVFARLYLDAGKRYLILIDEPELSLSMEWQQKFLPDVLVAPSCSQLIAITHSPFTFDNELDPYAGSLDISYLQKVMQ